MIDLAYHFRITFRLVINRFDLNPEVSNEIERVARRKGVLVVGRIGFDREVVEALVDGKTIIECEESRIKPEIIRIWNQLVRELAA